MRAHHHHHHRRPEEFGTPTFDPRDEAASFGGRGRRPERTRPDRDERRHDRHREPHGRGPGRRGPGRASRGDVRAAVLLLLVDEPMHGYQLMQTIADRTNGRWTPSPGAIYPALSLLEDEGLVQVSAEGGRKLAALTEAGRQHVEAERENWPDPFSAGDDQDAEQQVDLRLALDEIRDATRQVARRGNADQVKAAAELLAKTRRELYLLLAGE